LLFPLCKRKIAHMHQKKSGFKFADVFVTSEQRGVTKGYDWRQRRKMQVAGVASVYSQSSDARKQFWDGHGLVWFRCEYCVLAACDASRKMSLVRRIWRSSDVQLAIKWHQERTTSQAAAHLLAIIVVHQLIMFRDVCVSRYKNLEASEALLALPVFLFENEIKNDISNVTDDISNVTEKILPMAYPLFREVTIGFSQHSVVFFLFPSLPLTVFTHFAKGFWNILEWMQP